MVPFLILGVGINDMFIIYAAFSHTKESKSTEERISEALRKSGTSVTITSVTDFIAFLIGLTSDFKSVQIFCVYTGKLYKLSFKVNQIKQKIFLYSCISRILLFVSNNILLRLAGNSCKSY
jgi:hypothetical protein